jgi:hypothetical protein
MTRWIVMMKYRPENWKELGNYEERYEFLSSPSGRRLYFETKDQAWNAIHAFWNRALDPDDEEVDDLLIDEKGNYWELFDAWPTEVSVGIDEGRRR